MREDAVSDTCRCGVVEVALTDSVEVRLALHLFNNHFFLPRYFMRYLVSYSGVMEPSPSLSISVINDSVSSSDN